MIRSETHWNGVERQRSGLEENINALELTGHELHWPCVVLLSEGTDEI